MTKTILNISLLCFGLIIGGCSETPAGAGGSANSSSPAGGNAGTANVDAFIGTWNGKYSGLDDVMVIKKGDSDSEVVITIHASFSTPDTVNGQLVDGNRIEVPEQTMGGAPGTAVITLVDGKLQLQQSGLGMTVEGKDYERQ